MSETEKKPNRPTLAQALHSTFHPMQSKEDFVRELAGLTVAMTTAPEAVVLSRDGSVLATEPAGAMIGAQLTEQIIALSKADGEPQQTQDALHVAVSLPGGETAILVARMKSVGGTVRGLAFERLVNLSQLSEAMFRHPDIVSLEDLQAQLSSENTNLDQLASDIRSFVDADLVAVASYEADVLVNSSLSDQPVAARRATAGDILLKEISDARTNQGSARDVYLAANGTQSIAINAKHPRRYASLLPVIALAAVSGTTGLSGRQRKRRSTLMRFATVFLVIAGLMAIPLPDARRVPAEVVALSSRTITAPQTGVMLSVAVSDGSAVQAGITEIARLATNEITQELASAQADYSRALLERESARGARDAAALRNAELEAETLRARINLLEDRRARAQIFAPIDGLVVGENLDALIGATVRQGERLLDVVDPTDLALRLEVPDDLLIRIEDGEDGLFRPDFAPDQSFSGAVLSISPAQSARSDIAVFEGRASLPENTGQLRPGLRGVFIFDREFRLLGQIVYGALRDWVLLRLWI